jgi:hypothetical protein
MPFLVRVVARAKKTRSRMVGRKKEGTNFAQYKVALRNLENM